MGRWVGGGLVKCDLRSHSSDLSLDSESKFEPSVAIRNGLGSWSASAENLNLNQNNSNQSSLLFLPARTGEVDSKKVNLTEASTNS